VLTWSTLTGDAKSFKNKPPNLLYGLGGLFYLKLCWKDGKSYGTDGDNKVSPYRPQGLRSWLRGLRKTATAPTVETSSQEPRDEVLEVVNPVDAYYRDRAQNHLRVLYRFAVQSRSLAIRDVFAKISSANSLDLLDLLEVVHNVPPDLSDADRRSLASLFDSSILLTLADLLANTARDDLDTHEAAQLYDFIESIFGLERFSEQQRLLYIEALHEAGHYAKAEALAAEHVTNDNAPLQTELLALQRLRHTKPNISDWVDELNELYSGIGMTRVRLLDNEALPPLDRLEAEPVDYVDGPKVTVIVPTFSPGPGIRTAIRSLLQQTWKNLEIIVVDDASPDEYQDIFRELSELDSRIQVVHQEHNAGAYVARNAGLAIATGEFITTADDDDWSHPDKITSQASVLLKDPDIVATTSGHIRTTEQLVFRRINSSAKYLQMNYSSLMVRAQVIDEIGGWDTVNRGADSEFFSRVNEHYGADRLVRLLNQPLAFSRVWEGSLTSGEMYRGFIGTPRVLYLWAIRQWRWDLGKIDEKPTRDLDKPRPYAIPSNFEAGERNSDLGLFDVVYVADFFRQAKHVDYVLREIVTLSERGLRVGYIHLDSPRTTRPAGFPRILSELQLAKKLTQISLEDEAETRLLLAYDASLGMFAEQLRSNVVSHCSVVIDREPATLSGAQTRLPTNYSLALRTLDKVFDSQFKIVGATDRDQARLATRVPAVRLLPNSLIWRSHVGEASSDIASPQNKPIVGFHSFGNKYRWPNNTSVFRQVYLSDEYDTHFFGQLEPAISKFGEAIFDNCRLVDFKKVSTRDFIKGIDFWVYYPHPKLEDDVWEPVLLAMHLGRVVVLPPRLQSIYGDAAIYAEPPEIDEVVTGLATNPKNYERQARLGQEFVEVSFTGDRLYERINAMFP